MKRKGRPDSDGMYQEYEFDYAAGVRGKYYRQLLSEGASVVVLEPDVAKAFPSSEAVNRTLRSVLELTESTRRMKRTRSAPANRAKRARRPAAR